MNLKTNFNKYKNYIINIIAILFGFILAYVLNYKSTKKQALMLIWNDKCFHIHHWISYSMLLLVILFAKYFPIKIDIYIIFFLIGLILEDFLYRDIFKIREKCSKMCKFINKK